MIRSLAEHDMETALHCLRVSSLSVNIAKKMGVNNKVFLDSLKTSTALHDIGKIAVDRNLLNKATLLTKREFESIKKHVLFDAEAHFKVILPEMVKQVIRQHHERENGGGYPDALKSDYTCLPAKICAVADSYDAMTSLRSYQKIKSPSTASREIKENAGNIYDEKAVEAFMYIMKHAQQNCKTGR
jgi:putative nucleotidyltransferase with HDIG domain